MAMRFRPVTWGVLTLLAGSLLVGCGGGRESQDETATTTAPTSDLSGRIEADGSSTVGPFTTAAAERFQRDNPDVRLTVGVSGTGGGFERFCRGETDLSTASRPIKDEEIALCEKNGIEYVEFHVANDALTVVVNAQNDWATCLTVDELKRVWEPDSKIENRSSRSPAPAPTPGRSTTSPMRSSARRAPAGRTTPRAKTTT
jgi:phosphate transport system substrate-binding protein